MDDDFPAAHSHDVMWFAIDNVGQVAFFWSGAMGHSPDTAEDADLPGELWRLRHAGEEQLSRPDDRELPARLGFFYYEYGYINHPVVRKVECLEPYHLIGTPERPLHLDELPPGLRERCKRIRFEQLNFAASQLLQPLEQYTCDYRYRAERVAYLCDDGKTVRPIPGREREFPAFCEEFRKQSPDRIMEVIFDGAGEKKEEPHPESREENSYGQ
jgi:hypothetical protein